MALVISELLIRDSQLTFLCVELLSPIGLFISYSLSSLSHPCPNCLVQYIYTYDLTFFVLAWNSTLHIQLITWHFYIEVLEIFQNLMVIIPFSLPILLLFQSSSSQYIIPLSIQLLKPKSSAIFDFSSGPGGTSGKEPAWQCKRHKRCGLDPLVRKIPWKRVWQPTPVFLPGESHRQRNLAGLYSSWNSLGQNTGVGSHSLLQGSKPGLLHCRCILYQRSHQGSLGYSP